MRLKLEKKIDGQSEPMDIAEDSMVPGKALLALYPREEDVPTVNIVSAAQSFLTAFALPQVSFDSTVPIDCLLGPATCGSFLSLLKVGMLSGKGAVGYVNLYRGEEVISCHVTLRCLSRHQHQDHSGPLPGPAAAKLAVLSVRSAGAVGTASFLGIGLLGLRRVPAALLERVVGPLVEGDTDAEADLESTDADSLGGASPRADADANSQAERETAGRSNGNRGIAMGSGLDGRMLLQMSTPMSASKRNQGISANCSPRTKSLSTSPLTKAIKSTSPYSKSAARRLRSKPEPIPVPMLEHVPADGRTRAGRRFAAKATGAAGLPMAWGLLSVFDYLSVPDPVSGSDVVNNASD